MSRQPKEDDECASTGEIREDRGLRTETRFESLELDVKCPDTAVLLLGSRERSVLVAAAAALTKFAARGKENVQRLFELDVVGSLVPLIEHDDLFTRRFAARLLGEMAAISFVRNYLLEEESLVDRLATIAAQDTDLFMREYATLILTEISGDPIGAAKILERCTDLDFLFENFAHADPDVKKNTAELINNLLTDLTSADRISRSPGFNFASICRLLEEPYPEIQSLALSVLESLVARRRDDHLQQLFRESGALTILLTLLDKEEFFDLHMDVLRVLAAALENRETAETFINEGGTEKLFEHLESATKPEESRDALDVLVRLGNTKSGREILHNLGLVKYLFNTLRGSTCGQETRRIICYGIGTMCRYGPACERIMEESPAKLITDILKDETSTWTVREAGAFALKHLCVSDPRIRHDLLELGVAKYLKGLLKQTPATVSQELTLMSIDILTLIGALPDLRVALLDADLIDSLCASFEVKDRAADEVKIASCQALSIFCLDQRARECCLTGGFVKKLFTLVTEDASTPVQAAAVQLIQQLAGDRAIAEEFIRAGYLNFMMKNRAVSGIIPSWSTCIDALLSAHLPLKFAATGRISMHETTEDGFYVMRRHTCPFPLLDELFRLKMCPKEPIYVVNFADPRATEGVSPTGKDIGDIRSDSMSVSLEIKFGKLQRDPYLNDYLELFKLILAANESSTSVDEARPGLVDTSRIALRAKLLGTFVARQMSGPDPENPCVDHQLEIHVQEIRDDIETSVIPLGQLRAGGYLERALLFKVLADRICLPVSLVRGEYGKAWNEIAVPRVEKFLADESRPSEVFQQKFVTGEETVLTKGSEPPKKMFSTADVGKSLSRVNPVHRDFCSRNILPTSLLQLNYIVDLMDRPGDLIPIDSFRARTYCAPVKRCVISCEL